MSLQVSCVDLLLEILKCSVLLVEPNNRARSSCALDIFPEQNLFSRLLDLLRNVSHLGKSLTTREVLSKALSELVAINYYSSSCAKKNFRNLRKHL